VRAASERLGIAGVSRERRFPRRLFGDPKLLLAGLFSLIPVFFLISPPLPQEDAEKNCVRIISIGGLFNITVNCDSGTYIRLAENPQMLLERNMRGNSRPLYPATAWIIARPLSAFADCCLPESAMRFEDSSHIPTYAAYLIINWALLVSAVAMFLKLLPDDMSRWPVFVFLGVFLAVNEVTKAFFWTPHLQICNIFTPVCAMFLLRKEQERAVEASALAQLWFGLGVGTAVLFYEAFAVVAGAKGLYLLFGGQRASDGHLGRRVIVRRALKTGLLIVGFLIPPVVWILTIRLITGRYDSPEVGRFRQFVWLLDPIRGEGKFWGEFVANMSDFAWTVQAVLAFPILILLAVFAVRRFRRPSVDVVEPDGRMSALMEIALYQSVSALFFYSLMGFYATRLTWALVPGVLLVIGIKLWPMFDHRRSAQARRVVGSVLTVVSILYVVYWVVRPGPYS
jgi:hypothetical protein